MGLKGGASLVPLAALLGLFALQLATIVWFKRIKMWEILAIIGADLIWVLGSAIGLWIYYAQLTRAGVAMVVIVALAVLAFAELQGFGLWRWRKSRFSSGPAP